MDGAGMAWSVEIAGSQLKVEAGGGTLRTNQKALVPSRILWDESDISSKGSRGTTQIVVTSQRC
jgi:hypothetical protein